VLFKKIPKRKYLGILVIGVSVLFLFTSIFSTSLWNLPYANTYQQVVILGSYAALVVGAYLVAGPVGALIALIPAVTTGCFGGGGGGPKPEPDLGEPPEPPEE